MFHSPSRCGDAIRTETVQWLWKPWLAFGKLSVLDGDPGTGKSFLTCELAARLSRGEIGDIGAAPALLVSAEDAAEDTIAPRLLAAGADPERIHIWAMHDLPQLPRDLKLLDAAICGSGARLAVLDPLMAFLGLNAPAGVDRLVRRVTSALAELAADRGCAILLLRHLSKRGRGPAVCRGQGSMGIAGSARSAMLLALHPRDPSLRVLAMSKTNLGPVPAAKVFRLAGSSPVPRLEWLADDPSLAADDLLGEAERGREAWLRSVLEKGPAWASDVEAWAAAAGLSRRTLLRAKADLGAVSERRRGKWLWRLPGLSD